MDIKQEAANKRIIWIKYKCPNCQREFKRILKYPVYMRQEIVCAYDKYAMREVEEKRET